jgi:hypothetical protein
MLSGNLTYDKIYSKVCQDQKKGFGGDILKTKIMYDFKAPVVTSAEVGLQTANVLDIYFDEAISIETEPELTDFDFDFSGGAVTAESIIFNQGGINTHVVLTLSRAITAGETGTVSYTGTALKGTDGLSVNPFTQSVINNVEEEEEEYEAETETLCAEGRYTDAPSAALKTLINTTIKGLKDDGVWALGDCLYVRGVHESLFACQNWIKNAHNSTLNNAPTFTPKVGFTGNGSTMSINNNYTPSTEAVNLSLTSVTIAAISPTLGTTTGRQLLGAQNTVVAKRQYLTVYTAGNERMYLHSGTYSGNVNLVAGQHTGWVRINTTTQGYVDGYASGATTAGVNDVALVDYSVHELGYNLNGTPSGLYNGSISFSFYGGALDATKMLALYTRIKYFYDHVNSTF